ncbi:MAG: RNA polymerase sigma factor [Planctomycetes bacterium]|nr:RNA polymerase sigma factor [Planctomycetota bacterium]
MNQFRTTLWSRLGEAAAGRRTALDDFARGYRPPIVAFLRRKGLSPSDAEDVAQEVLVRLLSKDLLAQGDASKGRFRNYLIGITLRVLSEQRRHAQARKRGGDWNRVPLDVAPPQAERAAFEDLWLAEIVQRAMARVERANPNHHELLRHASQGLSSDELAGLVDKTAGATRVALHRARKALANALKEEVAAYCSSQDEYEEELATFARFFGE